MSADAPRPPLVAIVGPTGVGKTQLAIGVAEQLNAEIVSADSRCLYRGMDIGTAKPTSQQRNRVAHHLVDVAEPHERWSLARFKRAAMAAIAEVHRRGKLPLLVGGTGQYVIALLEGWQPPPRPADEDLRRELESYAAEHGAEALHSRLQQIDPQRAAELDPRNVRRVVRALEVYELTQKPPSQLAKTRPPAWRILRIGLRLPRQELYLRIDDRIERMLAAGLIEEVQALLERGLPFDHPNLSAIGYRQIAEYLRGRCSLESAVGEMRRLTRQFVRRQANWFREDDPQIEWFGADADASARVASRVQEWLRNP